MEFLTELWLPILLSAVFVFIASAIFHMALPMHKADWKGIPGESQVLDMLRNQGVQPGQYMFPYASSMKECESPEMKAKFERGPIGILVLRPPGPMNMGKHLMQWFLFTIVVGIFVAYAAYHSLPPDPSYLLVFRVTGTIAFLAYGISVVPESIWKGQSWGTTAKFIFDGLVYGLVTAGAFGWLWPELL